MLSSGRGVSHYLSLQRPKDIFTLNHVRDEMSSDKDGTVESLVQKRKLALIDHLIVLVVCVDLASY